MAHLTHCVLLRRSAGSAISAFTRPVPKFRARKSPIEAAGTDVTPYSPLTHQAHTRTEQPTSACNKDLTISTMRPAAQLTQAQLVCMIGQASLAQSVHMTCGFDGLLSTAALAMWKTFPEHSTPSVCGAEHNMKAIVKPSQLAAKPPGTISKRTVKPAATGSSTLAGPTATVTAPTKTSAVKGLPRKDPAAEWPSPDPVSMATTGSPSDAITDQDRTSAQHFGPRGPVDTFLPLPCSPILAGRARRLTPMIAVPLTMTSSISSTASVASFPLRLHAATAAPTAAAPAAAAAAAAAAGITVKGRGFGAKGGRFTAVRHKLLGAVKALPLGALAAAGSIGSLVLVTCCC